MAMILDMKWSPRSENVNMGSEPATGRRAVVPTAHEQRLV